MPTTPILIRLGVPGKEADVIKIETREEAMRALATLNGALMMAPNVSDEIKCTMADIITAIGTFIVGLDIATKIRVE